MNADVGGGGERNAAWRDAFCKWLLTGYRHEQRREKTYIPKTANRLACTKTVGRCCVRNLRFMSARLWRALARLTKVKTRRSAQIAFNSGQAKPTTGALTSPQDSGRDVPGILDTPLQEGMHEATRALESTWSATHCHRRAGQTDNGSACVISGADGICSSRGFGGVL